MNHSFTDALYRPFTRRHKTCPPWVALALAGILAAIPARAAIVIFVEDALLAPDRSGQQVEVWIDNDGPPLEVGGLDFSFQVGDGGSGGLSSGPTIQSVDLLTGTLFESKDFGGQFPAQDNQPQRQFFSVISLSAILPTGSGQRLATVTLDTTGFGTGSWELSLGGLSLPNTALFDWSGNPIAAEVRNGTLTVVPEPSAAVWTGAGLLALGLWRLRRERGRRGRSSPVPQTSESAVPQVFNLPVG